jgi:transcriptional regulator with XRE-family HTH domain
VDKFAYNLTFLKKKTNKTQSDIAFQVNKAKQTISGWENGVSEPSMKDLVILSDFFGVSIDELVNADLSNVHLNQNNGGLKIGQNVHLNVHGNVHPMGQNKPIKQVAQSQNSVVNEEEAPYQTAQMVVAAQAQTIKALEALNAVLSQQVAVLTEQVANLKREVPAIGKPMGHERHKSG